jgi:predicted transcriptional regulator
MRRRMRIILSAMHIPTEVERIEASLKEAGYPVAELLRRARVDVAQWQRWKAGKQDPRMGTWAKIMRAAEELLPERAA